ncbi:MAG: nuclear transport factor 2 family protein [Chryseobacterium culicis]|jgi:ketosteroid isomerase-like protein
MSKNVNIVQLYFDAVAKGEFEIISELFSDDIVWHQPGEGIQSGIYVGKSEVFAHLGNFMRWSDGTFAIDHIEYITENKGLVVASLHFKAEKGNKMLSMKGVDLIRVENEVITEVWLFSESVTTEDTFWNEASN